MRIPSATYRLQFTPQFGFSQASAVLDYLQELGISDIYASPIFHARSGSEHGYDVVDPNRLNPELGNVEQFDALIGGLWFGRIASPHSGRFASVEHDESRQASQARQVGAG